jgi:prolipoprotein diacylglyceryltransferase
MHPRLLTTPFFTLYTFDLLLASAYVAGFWWLMREGRREGLDGDALASLGLWAMAGAVIGAKALMIARALPGTQRRRRSCSRCRCSRAPAISTAGSSAR